jgi:hypothetical protein
MARARKKDAAAVPAVPAAEAADAAAPRKKKRVDALDPTEVQRCLAEVQAAVGVPQDEIAVACIVTSAMDGAGFLPSGPTAQILARPM